MRSVLLSFAVAMAVAVPSVAFAQVTAKPITEDQAREMAGKEKQPEQVQSPMLLEVDVSPRQFTTPALAKQNPNIWTTRQTAAYVCDRAQVRSVKIQTTRLRKGRLRVEVMPEVSTEWFRQDVDLTVTLLDADGKELGKRSWDDLTIGNDKFAALSFASRTKTPTLELEMLEQDFLALFSDSRRPKVRVVLDVQEGDEEEDED